MYKQIAANKRKTAILMIVFVILIAAISCIFAYFYNDWSISIITLVIATLYAVLQYYFASSIAVVMTGANEISKKDNPRFYNIVENLSITTGIQMPKVYIIEDTAPNAFATGRDPKHSIVAATTGLIDIMDDKELNAVMAHEMSHIKNYDIRVSMIVFGLTCLVGVLADIASRIFFYGGRKSSNEERSPVGTVLILAVTILSPIFAAIVQMAISREREYLADASAVNITRFPEGMISALKKLQTHSQPMHRQNSSVDAMYINSSLKKGFISNLFNTHPPIEKRIERLEYGKNTF